MDGWMGMAVDMYIDMDVRESLWSRVDIERGSRHRAQEWEAMQIT